MREVAFPRKVFVGIGIDMRLLQRHIRFAPCSRPSCDVRDQFPPDLYPPPHPHDKKLDLRQFDINLLPQTVDWCQPDVSPIIFAIWD